MEALRDLTSAASLAVWSWCEGECSYLAAGFAAGTELPAAQQEKGQQ